MTSHELLLHVKHWAQDRTTTLRLTASYLLIIMIMSLGFSAIFYQTSERELGRQLPPSRLFAFQDDYGPYRDYFKQRVEEGRTRLLGTLAVVNLITLVGGSALSYVLARRTLAPIERAMDAQARFAADASHELRTPLAAIQTENEVALRNPKLTLERAKELLRSNLEETMRLRTMSEQLLRLARGKQNVLKLAPVDLADAAHEGVRAMSRFAESRHVTIANSTKSLNALADRTSLVELVQILLDNAIKYSPERTTITLSSEIVGQQVHLRIDDQGIGIEEKDLWHIFERFFRADQSRSKTNVDGSGLGLSLAKELAAQMQGKILAESAPGEGSTFIIVLPKA